MELTNVPLSPKTIPNTNDVSALSNENEEKAINEQSLCTLKLIIGSIVQSADMDAVYEACVKCDQNTVLLIKDIFSKIMPADTFTLGYLRIDLKDNGIYKLENNCRGLALIQCSEDSNDTEMACFVGYKLEHFLGNFNSHNPHVCVDEFVYVEEEKMDEGFVVVEPEKGRNLFISRSKIKTVEPNVGVERVTSTDSEESSSDFIELGNDSAEIAPDYELDILRNTMREKHPTLKIADFAGGSISIAIQKFVELNVKEGQGKYGENNEFTCKDFTVYSAIAGAEKAKQFIEQHKNDNKLALIPYGVNERTFGEDHMVLLAVKNGESVIVDPKRGWFLGDGVPEEYIKKLKWQGFFDTTNCGFYVYHMITTAITASLDNNFKLENNNKSFGSNLRTFFKNGQPPQPEEIHEGIHKMIDTLSTVEESKTNSSATISVESI